MVDSCLKFILNHFLRVVTDAMIRAILLHGANSDRIGVKGWCAVEIDYFQPFCDHVSCGALCLLEHDDFMVSNHGYSVCCIGSGVCSTGF